MISLTELGIEPSDEIITAPVTFVATAEVIFLLGAKLLFVDIELDACNIDASKIEAKITSKTKAIMSVSCLVKSSIWTTSKRLGQNKICQ